MNYSERLTLVRKSKGFTQVDVAKGTGLTEGAVQNYEYGKRKPSFDALIALADFFDVSLDYLVGRSDEAERR